MAMPAASKQILAGAIQLIDSHLDPAVQDLAKSEASAAAGAASEVAAGAAAASPPEAGTADVGANPRTSAAVTFGALTPKLSRLELDLLKARAANQRLHAELEDARTSHELVQKELERRSTEDAVKVAKLLHERDQLERDGRTKRRRISEMESELLLLKGEMDSTVQTKSDLLEESKMKQQELESRVKVTEDSCQAQVDCLWDDLCLEQKRAAEAQSRAEHAVDPLELDKLRCRVRELEGEAAALRLAAAQCEPDRALAAKLSHQHLKYDQELKELHSMRLEMQDLRAEVVGLKNQETSLRTVLEARDKALQDKEEIVMGSVRTARALDAFTRAAGVIIEETKQLASGVDAGATAGQKQPDSSARPAGEEGASTPSGTGTAGGAAVATSARAGTGSASATAPPVDNDEIVMTSIKPAAHLDAFVRAGAAVIEEPKQLGGDSSAPPSSTQKQADPTPRTGAEEAAAAAAAAGSGGAATSAAPTEVNVKAAATTTGQQGELSSAAADPTSLRSAWGRIQGVIANLRHQHAEKVREMQQNILKERRQAAKNREDLEQLKTKQELATKRIADLEKECRIAKEEAAAATGKAAALQATPEGSKAKEEDLKAQLKLSQQHEAEAQERVKARDATLQQIQGELQEKSKSLAVLEEKVAQLSQQNTELASQLKSQAPAPAAPVGDS